MAGSGCPPCRCRSARRATGGHSVSGNGRGRTRRSARGKSCAGRKWPPQRKENARLRKALAASKAREGATGPWPAPARRRTVLEPSPDQKETVRSLRTELRRLDKEVVRRDKENARLNTRSTRRRRGRSASGRPRRSCPASPFAPPGGEDTWATPRPAPGRCPTRVFWLRHALEVSKAGKEKLKARLAKLRAAGATLSKLPSDEAAQLRAALRRSRRQKTTIEALRKDNGRLRRTMRKLETRKAALEVQPAKLRRDQEGTRVRACRASSGQEDVVEVAVRCRRRSPQALRRSRRQKATIKSLSRENARLRKGAKTSRNRIESLGSPA